MSGLKKMKMIKQGTMKMDSFTIKYRGSFLHLKNDSKDPVEEEQEARGESRGYE